MKRQRTYRDTFAHQRYAQHRLDAPTLYRLRPGIFAVRQRLDDLDDSRLLNGPADKRSAAHGRWVLV